MTADFFNGMAQGEAAHPVTNRRILNAGPPDEPRDKEGEWTELPDEHWTGTHQEMRARADAIMRSQTTSEHPKLGTIKLNSHKARSKTLGHMATPHEFQSVQAIPEITSKGRVTSGPDDKHRPDVVAIHKIEHGVKIGDSKYKGQATVREMKDGSKTSQHFYLHRIDRVANKKPAVRIHALRLAAENIGPAGQRKPNA
jgi:hypothetical protein